MKKITNKEIDEALKMIIIDWNLTKDGKVYKPSTTRKDINTIKQFIKELKEKHDELKDIAKEFDDRKLYPSEFLHKIKEVLYGKN